MCNSRLNKDRDHHRFYRLQTQRNDVAKKADEVFGVVGAVRFVGDAAAFVGAHLILVNHPVQRAAVAEAVLKRLGRDAFQRQEFVVAERGRVPAWRASSFPRAN